MEAGEIIIKTKIETDEFEDGLEDLGYKVKEKGSEIGSIFEKFFSKGFGKLKSSLSEFFVKMSGLTSGLAKGLFKSIGLVTKLGLGLGTTGLIVGGLLAGALILGKAFEKFANENEQIKANIQYIIFAIGKALEPAVNSVANIISKIVGLLFKAVQYAMALINIIAGRNLFANASAEEFAKSMEDAEKNTNKTGKNLKNMKKQLAGFDEMNVLNDTSGGGGGGGVSPITMPDFDVSNLTNFEKEIQKIFDGWDKLGTDMKKDLDELSLYDWFNIFGGFGLAVKGVEETFYGFWEIIDGFFDFVKGIIDLIVGLVTGDSEKIDKAVIELLDGLWKVIDGFWNILKGGFDIAIGVIIGLIDWLWQTTLNLLKSAVKWIDTNVRGFLVKIFGDLFGNVLTDQILGFINTAISFFTDMYNGVKNIVMGILKIFKGDFKGGLEQVFGGLKTIFLAPINAFISGFNTLIKGLNKFKIDVPSWVPGALGGKKLGFNIPLIPKLAKGGIINMPGRGVAIGGERGQEGVIPLTDSQQMELLGQAIGKYININATVPVYVGNRQIAREIRKINAEDDFAYNGG